MKVGMRRPRGAVEVEEQWSRPPKLEPGAEVQVVQLEAWLTSPVCSSR